MHRVHSDISEYDAQGALLKRTITDSYTSIADAAAPPLKRHRSSPGPQEKLPLTVPPSAPTRNTQRPDSTLPLARDPRHHGIRCPFCSSSWTFNSRSKLARHMCVRHGNYVSSPINALEHQKLKRAYKTLRRTLQSLSQSKTMPLNADEECSAATELVTQTLNDLDLGLQLSSSEGSELVDADDVNPLEEEQGWSR